MTPTNTRKPPTFEDFLKAIHARDYCGTDDDRADAFNSWLGFLQKQDIINYAEAYGKQAYDLGCLHGHQDGQEDDYIGITRGR